MRRSSQKRLTLKRVIPDLDKVPAEYRDFLAPLSGEAPRSPAIGSQNGKGGRLLVSAVHDDQMLPCFEHELHADAEAGILWLCFDIAEVEMDRDRRSSRFPLDLVSESDHSNVQFGPGSTQDVKFQLAARRRTLGEYPFAVLDRPLVLLGVANATITTSGLASRPGYFDDPVQSSLRVLKRKQEAAMQVQKCSIAIVDMVGYGDMAGVVEKLSGVTAVMRLNNIINARIQKAVREVGLDPRRVVHQSRGDGALLVFEDAGPAIEFTTKLHGAAEKANSKTRKRLEVYRIGVATGEVSLVAKGGIIEKMAGDAVIRAARLEQVAPAGGTLIDEATWKSARSSASEFSRLRKIKAKNGDQLRAASSEGIAIDADSDQGRALAVAKAVEKAVDPSQLRELLQEWNKEGYAPERASLIELRVVAMRFAQGEERVNSLIQRSQVWS